MTNTPNRNYPLPTLPSLLTSFGSISAAFGLMDADVADIYARLPDKADLDSPALTGGPTAPTPDNDAPDNRVATMGAVRSAVETFSPSNISANDINTGTLPDARLSFSVSAFARTIVALNSASAWRADLGLYSSAEVDALFDSLINSAPGTLNQLNELAAALGNDANFASTMTTALAGKVGTGRTISAAGIATGGGDLSANRTITVPKSTQPQAVAFTDDTTAMTPVRVLDAMKARAFDGEIIETRVISGNPTSVNFTGLGAYQKLRLVFDNVTLNTNAIPTLRVSTNNGSSYLSTGYAANSRVLGSAGGNLDITTAVPLTPTNDTGVDRGVIDVDMFNTNAKAFFHGSNFGALLTAGFGPSGVNDALRLTTTGGTAQFTGGTITLIGWRNRT